MIGLDFGTTNSCAAFGDYRGEVSTVSLAPVNTPPYDAPRTQDSLHHEGLLLTTAIPSERLLSQAVHKR